MVHVFTFGSWKISDFDFPIFGYLFLYKPRYCWVPQNKWNTFPPFFIVLLYRVVACVIDIFCWSRLDFSSFVNLFIGIFYGLLYFIYRVSILTAGRLSGRFINNKIKIYARWFTWETLNGFITNGLSSLRIIGEEIFLLLNSVSTESSLNGVVLIGKFFFRVGAAKSSFITSLLFSVSVVLITLFWQWRKRESPANIFLFKVSNRNTRKKCQWRCSGVFIVNFEHISHLFLEFLLLTLNE